MLQLHVMARHSKVCHIVIAHHAVAQCQVLHVMHPMPGARYHVAVVRVAAWCIIIVCPVPDATIMCHHHASCAMGHIAIMCAMSPAYWAVAHCVVIAPHTAVCHVTIRLMLCVAPVLLSCYCMFHRLSYVLSVIITSWHMGTQCSRAWQGRVGQDKMWHSVGWGGCIHMVRGLCLHGQGWCWVLPSDMTKKKRKKEEKKDTITITVRQQSVISLEKLLKIL